MKKKTLSPGIQDRITDLNKVLKNGRPKCELEELAIIRQLDDLAHGHTRGLIWDEEAAARTVEFFQLLVHGVGSGWEWSGKPFKLNDYQEHCIVAPIFGWKTEDNTRRFQIAGVEIPRKNGKTVTAAGLAMQGLAADMEQGAEVYAAATAQEQATLVFEYAKKMLGAELRKRLKIFQYSIEFPTLNAVFRPVSSQHKILDGKNTHRCIIDELHQHKTRDVWDIFVNSTAARLNSLIFWISYAGFDRQSIWWDQHEYGRRLLEKAVDDDSYFYYRTGIDKDDDWRDPDVWWKANPQLGLSMDEKKFSAKAKRAEMSPAEENDFKRVHLNCVTEQSVRYIPMHLWDEQSGIDPYDGLASKFWRDELVGKPCFAGLDLASTRDLTAWVLLFPWDEGYRVLAHHFAPEEANNERAMYDKQSYEAFAQKGYINLTDGSATDYQVLKKQIWEDHNKYDIQMVAFDPHNALMLYQELVDEGWPYPDNTLKAYTQGAANFNEPMIRLVELLKEVKLDHANDPLLRWQAANIVSHQNMSGYLKPDKQNSQDKIDGMVALLMALGLAIAYGRPQPAGLFYESHALEVF